MSTSKRAGYYNATNGSVSFQTRFGPIFLEPNQIIRDTSNKLVAQDNELDVKVQQKILKTFNEGESESTLFFRPVKAAKPVAAPEKVVLTSREGPVKEKMPAVRVSATEAPQNRPVPASPTHQELIEQHEAKPPTVARVSAADRSHPIVDEAEAGAKIARKISDVIEVNEAGIPVDAEANADGTITFEGNKYMSAGALLKFIGATGRVTKKAQTVA